MRLEPHTTVLFFRLTRHSTPSTVTACDLSLGAIGPDSTTETETDKVARARMRGPPRSGGLWYGLSSLMLG